MCLRAAHLATARGRAKPQGVEVAERFADGLATYAELDRAYQAAASLVGVAEVAFHPDADAANAAGNAASPVIVDGLYFAPAHAAAAAVKAAAEFAVLDLATSEELAPMRTWVFARDSECSTQAALLRDIVANPFATPRPIQAAWLRWNDSTVVRLAQAIYDERRWGDMPILADALLDAGCDNEDILVHCRQQGKHTRGCWVLDLVLGKE
jgi:hypothetical protein